MAKFVFSDPHFNSESIIRNGQRPFVNIAEMNAKLIENYNSVVSKQDICYWLGDIMYGATPDKVKKILQQMRGRKYLIMGNRTNHCQNLATCQTLQTFMVIFISKITISQTTHIA